MLSLTTNIYKTTIQLLSAAVLTVAAASAQCGTGFGTGCSGLLTPNPETGGPVIDGNWKLAAAYPSSPSNPNLGTAAQQKLIEDPCSVKKLGDAWVDTPDGSPPVFGYWSTDGPNSNWISPYDEVNQPGGLYIYTTTFTAPASWTSPVRISLRLQSDNETYSIYGSSPAKKGCQHLGGNKYNGSSFTGSPINCPTCFQTWTNFTTTNFVVAPSAPTSLYVVVRNRGVGGLDSNYTPTGFRVEFYPATGSNYTQSTGADFNGDGQADVAVVDGGTNKIAVYLNTKGEFTKDREYPVGTNPVFAAAADLNGDGRPDLVVANYGSGTVSVLLNNGKGTFGKQVSYPAGDGPVAIAIGDLNGDGIPDLAVANVAGGVTILLGTGGGAFQTGETISVGDSTESSPSSIAIGDLNGDGIPDLVMTDGGTGAVVTMRGNGNGSFQSPITSAQYFIEPGSVALADLNGDGIPDLVLSDAAAGQVATMYGNGDGTFSLGQAVTAGTSPQGLILVNPETLAVADPPANAVTFLQLGSTGLTVTNTVPAGPTPVSLVAVGSSTGADVAAVDNGNSSIFPVQP